MAIAFAWIPLLGVESTAQLMSMLNLGVLLATVLTSSRVGKAPVADAAAEPVVAPPPLPGSLLVAFATGSAAVAVVGEFGIGRERVQGRAFRDPVAVLGYREGPDATISVIQPPGQARNLVIDGFSASNEEGAARYMEWMGRLPMLLHPAPLAALVICFGTGQTSHAVRDENPEHLDIVDLSEAVFALAPLFEKNHRVLEDPRVRAIVMDGRAYLRRADVRYDVITLEPMPPNFAGVNSLYSLEFYKEAAARLNDGGIVAQWLPYHLVTPADATAIATTFTSVFEDALLWIDPMYGTGVLVGRRLGAEEPLGTRWPGLERRSTARSMTPDETRAAVALRETAMRRYAELGLVITDDNQLLSYGWSRFERDDMGDAIGPANLQLVRVIARAAAAAGPAAATVAPPSTLSP